MITDSVTLKVNSDTKQSLKVIDTAKVNFTQDQYIKVVSVDADEYDGSYEVTPSVNAQTLNTADKILRQDVSVLGIPTYETSNQYGKTFIIGD